MTSLGVCSRRESVSLACRQKLYLNSGVTLFSMPMFAPAEKNFSPLPVMHDHFDVLIEARVENRFVELAHHLVRVRVCRRIVHLDERDVCRLSNN